MSENYKILGVSETATNEEIEAAYNTLKNKYSKDRFLEGEAGNIAAKNLTKLENAYAEIKAERSTGYSDGNGKDYSEIENLIRDGKLAEAQSVLDNTNDRNAEWHYYQSVVFYKKSWMNESIKQLEIAMEMDPDNAKYKSDYEKLKSKNKATEQQFYSGNAGNAAFTDNGKASRQMGGNFCSDVAQCLATWCIMDALCSCCATGCR